MWQSCDLIGPWSAHIISAAACSNMQHNVCMRVCVCVRSQLISCCVWLSHGDTFLYVWKAWNRSETPHYTLAAVMEAASVCFIFAVVEQTETRKRKQQEKPTKQIKTRPTQTLTAAERDDTEPSLSLCRRPQTSTRSLKKQQKKTSLMMLALLLKLQHVLIIFSAWLQGQSTERSRAAETLQLQTVYKRWPSQAHWSLRVQVLGGNMLVL